MFGHGCAAIFQPSIAEVEELIAAAEGQLGSCSEHSLPSFATERGLTRLLAAARRGHLEVVRLLPEAGADVEKIYLATDSSAKSCLGKTLGQLS